MNEILLLALAMMLSGCSKLPSTPIAEARGGIPPRLEVLPPGCVVNKSKGGAVLCYPVYKPASWRTVPEKPQPKGGVPNERAKRRTGLISRHVCTAAV